MLDESKTYKYLYWKTTFYNLLFYNVRCVRISEEQFWKYDKCTYTNKLRNCPYLARECPIVLEGIPVESELEALTLILSNGNSI